MENDKALERKTDGLMLMMRSQPLGAISTTLYSLFARDSALRPVSDRIG